MADDVLDAIRALGGECHAWEADLAVPDNIPLLFNKAEEEFGPVEILINNAAHDKCDTFIPKKELEKSPLFLDEYPMNPISVASLDEHFSVNTRAVALMMAEFSRRYIEKKAK